MEVTRGNLEISDVSFSLEPGDVMGLVGKSGAGKSTIMESILGMIPNKGDVKSRVDGQRISIQTSSGYSTQEGSLYPMLSLHENLELFASLRGVEPEAFEERERNILQKLHIWADRERKIQNFSGGMKKRSDLAAALIHEPDILFMDEPFAGIDPPQRMVIWEMISSVAEQDRIVILTSHMISEMKGNCNKYGLVYESEFASPQKVSEMMSSNGYRDIGSFLEDVFSL